MTGSSQTILQNINPFPGLRPFTSQEAHLFFGREGQVDEIVSNLKKNRFVAVVGASGSGKSSLIYCGVIPSLVRSSGSNSAGEWLIVNTRPGNSPLFNLLNDINESTGKKLELPNPTELFATKDGVLNFITKATEGKKNILLMVDQFEEIFRFNKIGDSSGNIEDHDAYVNFIVEVVRQSKLPVYVVITMRSDFIGECSRFQEFTGLINQSNYLVPRMTITDFRRVIEGPVKVAGAEIDPSLVTKLLADLGDNPDQLPVLQHVLMRTWDYWQLHNDVTKPLSVSDYEAVGRIEKALSEHANEAFDELDEKEKTVCESIFRTITEKGGDNRGVRRPTKVSQLGAISNSKNEEIQKIIDIFRAPGRSFIVPAHSVKLTKDSVIDISHESFMRIWERLRVWVDEEASAVQMYKRLAESANLFQSGKTNLWRPPDLQLALNWRTKTNPTLTWAERHDPAFERTMVFLETSEKEFIKEEENKLRLQKRQLRRTRIFALVLGSAAILSMGLFVWTQQLRVEAEKEFKRAETQRALAEDKTAEANQQKQLAEKAAIEAQTQRNIAEESSKIAETRRVEAENNLQEARRQESIAQKNLSEANTQRKIALDNEKEANNQKEQAEKARVEAFQRRMLSTAKSMAVKSIQISNNPDLKALMAYQAYQFNEKYKGTGHDVDIYSSLYQSLKTLLGQDYNVLKGHDNAVRSLFFIPGTSTLISAGSDGKILKWDVNDLEKKSEIIAENAGVIEKIQVSGDGKFLVAASSLGGINLFNLRADSTEPVKLIGEDPNIRTMTIGPDNKTMYTSGLKPIIEYWDLESGMHSKIAELDSRINSLAISPDGALLAGGTKDGRLIIWRVKGTTISLEVYKDSTKSINSVSFSPDGAYLSCGNVDGDVLLFTADTFKLVSSLTGHNARVTEIGFSPDSKTMATSSYDGKVLFWELANLTNPPIVMDDNSGYVFSLAFSPDGKNLFSSSTEEPRLIKRPTVAGMLADQICGLLTRNFTLDEWKTYVGSDIPYEKTCPSVKLEIGIKKNEQ
jgi:WD40 repeat protein/energy-coupling factor transporter ATP-binding protein EcfA2